MKRLAALAVALTAIVPAAAHAAIIDAAGDIACPPGTAVTATTCAQQRTSDLIATVSALLPLGDNQYNTGALSAYQHSYGPTWGRFNVVSHPVPGNHEYGTSAATGYFDYFNGVGVTTGRAGTRGKGWYSYDLGGWHMIALNSECTHLPAGTCSSEETWLRADLAAHKNKCTLAYWHEPRFYLGSTLVKNAQAMAPMWNDLYAANADVVLNGHKHNYQRSVPLGKAGTLDSARGIREFIVGTGGEDHSGSTATNAQFPVFNNKTFGVLNLTLGSGTYHWKFIPEPGGTFTDSGSGTCH